MLSPRRESTTIGNPLPDKKVYRESCRLKSFRSCPHGPPWACPSGPSKSDRSVGRSLSCGGITRIAMSGASEQAITEKLGYKSLAVMRSCCADGS